MRRVKNADAVVLCSESSSSGLVLVMMVAHREAQMTLRMSLGIQRAEIELHYCVIEGMALQCTFN